MTTKRKEGRLKPTKHTQKHKREEARRNANASTNKLQNMQQKDTDNYKKKHKSQIQNTTKISPKKQGIRNRKEDNKQDTQKYTGYTRNVKKVKETRQKRSSNERTRHDIQDL